MSKPSTIGVCVFPPPALNRGRTVNYPTYIHELLGHAGLFYQSIAFDDLQKNLDQLGLLITIGDCVFDQAMKSKISDWMQRGGAWLAIGGTCSMDDVFGAKAAAPTYSGWGGGSRSLGEGYLSPNKTHRILEFADKPIHFFAGCSVEVTDGTILATALDKHGRSDGSAAIIEKSVGKGRAILICVDLPGTIVRIQQGVCVTRDGVPARDGSAPIDDSVLKSGDGGVLDWYFDRNQLPGMPGLSIFTRPIADQWREILLRSIFYLAEQQRLPVYVLWLWPRNLPAIGHISHDSDGNEPDMAELLLASLDRARIKSTWCVIAPGYAPAMIEKIGAAGHELAMHYDAITEGLAWGEQEFEKQWKYLRGLLGVEIVTNKNHYLRWQGDMEFWDWCEKRAIQLDQSKGPSKTGEAGFNFGTSHPYFPISFDGRISSVIELPTLAQDLGVFGPESMGLPLLLGAANHHGVAHFLFHPAHFGKPQTALAMEAIVQAGRQRGMEWWTAKQINEWVRNRRSFAWQFDSPDSITITTRDDLSQATVLCLGPEPSVKINDQSFSDDSAHRWGFDFASCILDLPGRSSS